MIQHAHALVLAVICIVATFVGLRSSYVFMISLFFYGAALLLNLVTTLHYRGKKVILRDFIYNIINDLSIFHISEHFWSILVILSQIMPFLYFGYIIFALASTLMPMMGRFGSGLNPDLLIGGLCAFGTILSMGFVVSLFEIYKNIQVNNSFVICLNRCLCGTCSVVPSCCFYHCW